MMSRSLISMRPRRQIPAGAGAEPITGCSPGGRACPWGRACGATAAVLTEAGGLGGPAAIGLAGAGRVPQQQEAGPAAVAHHGAHPPVVPVHHRVKIRLGPPAVHCGQGWKGAGSLGSPGGDPDKAVAAPGCGPAAPPGMPRPSPRGFTSAEGLVAQPAAAAVPTLAPLQLLVPPLAAPHADGRRARPVSVQLSWGHRGQGRAERGWRPRTPFPAAAQPSGSHREVLEPTKAQPSPPQPLLW